VALDGLNPSFQVFDSLVKLLVRELEQGARFLGFVCELRTKVLNLLAKELLRLDDQVELPVQIFHQDAGVPLGLGQPGLEFLAEDIGCVGEASLELFAQGLGGLGQAGAELFAEGVSGLGQASLQIFAQALGCCLDNRSNLIQRLSVHHDPLASEASLRHHRGKRNFVQSGL
jgi:hypothetical protein